MQENKDASAGAGGNIEQPDGWRRMAHFLNVGCPRSHGAAVGAPDRLAWPAHPPRNDGGTDALSIPHPGISSRSEP